MELQEAIRTRRSVRKYEDRPVPREVLEEILDTACWAPSGDNCQPWYFLALTNPEEIGRIRNTMERVSEEIRPHLEGFFKGYPQVIAEETRFLRSVSSAPVCILVFLQKEYPARDVAVESAAAAMQTLLLAAWEKGLGTCWVNAATILGYAPTFRQEFAPGKGEFLSLITMGYPAQSPNPPIRRAGRWEIC